MATAVPLESIPTFGALLHFLRRRARLTQRELAIAVGYSEAHVSRLESDQRLPDLTTLIALIVPALDLDDDPPAVARLLELAAAARGESLAGTSVTLTHTTERRSSSEFGVIEAVPPLPAGLVEREDLLRLRQRLERDRCVLLCGWAGVGKTTLAAALAHAQPAQPVFWLTLAENITATVDVLVRQLALFLLMLGDETVLTLAEHAPDADAALPLDQQMLLLGAALARYPALLCFDNLHVAQDPALLQVLQHLIASSPAGILLLSREQLRLPGVASFTLGGLTAPESQRLLDNLHAHLDPNHATQLIEHTAGNPMLLRLAVGQLSDRGGDAALINHLATEPHVASYIVQTTLDHVAPDTRRLIELLAVVGQPVNLYAEALLELSQAALGTISWGAAVQELTRRYLIDNPAQAALPPLLRDHVYATLIGDLEQRRRLHRVAAEWLEATDGDAVVAAQHYASAGQPQAATAMLSGKIDAILSRGQSDAAATLIDGLLASARRSAADLVLPLLSTRADLLVHTLRAAEAEANYREALSLATQPTVRAHLVWRMAASLLQRGHVAETLALVEATAAALSPGDTLLQAYLAVAGSKALLMLSRFSEAEVRAGEALLLADRLDGTLAALAAGIQARAGAGIAIIMQITGRREAAIRQWHQVIAAASGAELTRFRHRCMANLANILYEQGDLAASFDACGEALSGLRLIGDSYAMSRVLHTMALIHATRAEWVASLALLDEACTIKRSIGDLQGLGNSLNQRADVLIALGQVQEAHNLSRQILAECGESGEPRSRCMYLIVLVMSQLVLGDLAAAEATLTTIAQIPAAGTDERIGNFLVNRRALLTLLQGRPAAAEQQLLAAPDKSSGLEIALERQLLLSLIALDQGDASQVAQLTDAVAQQAAAANYVFHQQLAQQIAAAAPGLPLSQLPRLLWCRSEPFDQRMFAPASLTLHAEESV